MLRYDERWVIFMEAAFRWVPHYAPQQLDVVSFGKLLQNVVGTATATQHTDVAGESITLDAAEFRPKTGEPTHLILLISFSNDFGADPGFINKKTRKGRVEPKKVNEGNGSSAHVVIGVASKTQGSHTYFPAMLEDVPSVGKTKITGAVNRILHECAEFRFNDMDGVEQTAVARFEMLGLEDEKVGDDAAGGRVSYFVAIKDRRDRPDFDESFGAKITQEETRLRPTEAMREGRSLAQYLKKLVTVARKHGFDRVRIHYVRKDNKSRTLTAGTHREDAEDFLIKRVEKINVSKPVNQVHEEVSEELASAMIKLL